MPSSCLVLSFACKAALEPERNQVKHLPVGSFCKFPTFQKEVDVRPTPVVKHVVGLQRSSSYEQGNLVKEYANHTCVHADKNKILYNTHDIKNKKKPAWPAQL